MANGVLAALATPLTEDGALDHAGLARLVHHILGSGASGVCPAGSTGEGPLLSRALRTELTAAVVGLAPPPTPVIPATVSLTPTDTLADLEAYAEAGATAALVPPPFYYPLSEASILRFFDEVAERSPIPLLLYNIPAMTKVVLPVRVVGELAAHPQVIGMKDSSRDLEYFQSAAVATRRQHFSLLTGSDTLLVASMAAGAAGTIAASVNLVPAMVVSLYRAILDGEDEAARTLQERLIGIVLACRRPGFPAGWKAALALHQLCGATVAPPLVPATLEATRVLADELAPLITGSD
ncbi:MAG: dihydrodipicolinate synthase family protein [Acidimicrobiales bacterium]